MTTKEEMTTNEKPALLLSDYNNANDIIRKAEEIIRTAQTQLRRLDIEHHPVINPRYQVVLAAHRKKIFSDLYNFIADAEWAVRQSWRENGLGD